MSIILNLCCIYSQNNKDTTEIKSFDINVTLSKSKADTHTNPDSVKKVGFIGYPFAFYSPETKLAFGAGGMIYFSMAPQMNVGLSKITVSAYYTTNKQYSFSVSPRIFFPGINKFYLEGNLNYSKSSLAFYGLGNNTPNIDSCNYISKIFEINAQVTNFKIFKNIMSGLVFEYASNKMIDKQSNPNLLSTDIRGVNGGKVGGLGFTLIADTRDNTSYPSSGFYSKISTIFFRKPFGSDFTYDKFITDFRKYWMPYGSHIVAVQLFGQFSRGETPFFAMPAVGGSYKMRGYLEGRYRDMQYVTAQAEYRKILYRRIGIAAFYSIGEVSPNFKTFSLNEIKHTYGFGLRLVFDKKEKINLRADLGFAENNTGIYFNLEEAF